MTFKQALSARTLHHMIAHALGIALGLATFALEGGASSTMANCRQLVLTTLQPVVK
jgi:hypothetical protein